MEFCLSILAGLGIFWVGLFSYAACKGSRFGFDEKNPKQLRKIIIKPITMVVMIYGISLAVLALSKSDFWGLPGTIIFLVAAGLGFLGGLFIGIWSIEKTGSFLSAIEKIFIYPACGLAFVSSFYFLIVSVIRLF